MSNAAPLPSVGSRVSFSAGAVRLPDAPKVLFDLHHDDRIYGTLVQFSPDATGRTIAAVDVGLPYYCIVAREDIHDATDE